MSKYIYIVGILYVNYILNIAVAEAIKQYKLRLTIGWNLSDLRKVNRHNFDDNWNRISQNFGVKFEKKT